MFILSETRSVANTFIAEIRDQNIQKDSMRFRKNLERLGEFFAYELSKGLKFKSEEITTPLGTSTCEVLEEQPILATILRAGLPLQQGLLNVFDQASCCFISAYRKTEKSGSFVIQMEYVSTPDLAEKTVIMADPMIATGRSMVMCCNELIKRYKIGALHIVTAIASSEGVAHVEKHLPHAKLWIGAIDDEMTSKCYIVPGLGDAGDLAYGEKI